MMTTEPRKVVYRNSPITHAFISVGFDALKAFDFESLGQQLDRVLSDAMDGMMWETHATVYEKADDPGSPVVGIIVRSQDAKMFVQATTTSCVVLRLAPYEHWGRFFPVFIAAWTCFQQFVAVQKLTRVGIRYTNQFRPVDAAVPLGDVLNITPIKLQLGTMTPTESLFTFVFEDADVALEISVDDGPNDDDGRTIVLDIDAAASDTLLETVGADIGESLEKIHAFADKAFEGCITQQTRGSLL